MSKEAFYSNLRTALYEVIPTDAIPKVMDVVTQQLGIYDLQLKPHEIVVYDRGDAEMLKRFFIAKATEGLTDESLKTYRTAIFTAFRSIGKHIKDVDTDTLRTYFSTDSLDFSQPRVQPIRTSFAARSTPSSRGLPRSSSSPSTPCYA